MAGAAGPPDGRPPGDGKGNGAEREKEDEANAASTDIEQQRVSISIEQPLLEPLGADREPAAPPTSVPPAVPQGQQGGNGAAALTGPTSSTPPGGAPLPPVASPPSVPQSENRERTVEVQSESSGLSEIDDGFFGKDEEEDEKKALGKYVDFLGWDLLWERPVEVLADGELDSIVSTLPPTFSRAVDANREITRRRPASAVDAGEGRPKRTLKKTQKVLEQEAASSGKKTKEKAKNKEKADEISAKEKKVAEKKNKEKADEVAAKEKKDAEKKKKKWEMNNAINKMAKERADEAIWRSGNVPPDLLDTTGYARPTRTVRQVEAEPVQNTEGPVRHREGGPVGRPFSQPLESPTFNFSNNQETIAAGRRNPVSSAQQTDDDRQTALDEEVARAAQQEEWAQEYHHGISGQDEAVARAAQRMEWQRGVGHAAIEGDVHMEDENPVEPDRAANAPQQTQQQRPTNAPGGLPPPGYRPYQQQNIPAHHRTLSNALTWAPPNSNVFNLSHIWHTFELLRLSQNILQYHRPSVRQPPNAAAHLEDAMMPLRWVLQRHGHDTYLATAPTNWDVRTLLPYAADNIPYAADTNARPRHAGNLRSTIVQLRVAVWVMRNYNGTAGRNELSDEESAEMEVALRDLEEFLGYLEL